jgi:hypothetical protein
MNAPECKFDDYLKEKAKYDIHLEVSAVSAELAKDSMLQNVIFYGPPGVGKYSCALDYISKYSPSHLAYERKAIVETSKGQYAIKISDVHFEVDMGLLGCNSKQTWNELFTHITNIVNLRSLNQGIILCRNFDRINAELLEVFYSYFQTNTQKTRLAFVLLTEAHSFIPTHIVKRCHLVRVTRPKRIVYAKLHKIPKTFDVNTISNIKSWKADVNMMNEETLKRKLVSLLESYENFDFEEVRKTIYDILIQNHNLVDILWDVVESVVQNGLDPEKGLTLLKGTYSFLELYNNNYRPIYHLERYMCFLLRLIHEL